ncbi:MAG: FAM83 family protein [Candidatus Paracaedibacteraceae bacterium]|nr:FAM83 family protein [Candidatus Paracaedibacteraceae bacterium]
MNTYLLQKIYYYIINTLAALFIVNLGTLSASDLSAPSTHNTPPTTIFPFSSEIGEAKIGNQIWEIIKEAEKMITIASDKCTNEEFLDDLLQLHTEKPALNIRIVSGQDVQTTKIFTTKYVSIPNLTYTSIPRQLNGGKMHNKFIVVDNKIVITGSPNFTYAAYNYNVESFVAIYDEDIATLYLRYYDYLLDPNDKNINAVKELMDACNTKENAVVQICLAPIANIADFIIERINAADIVNINMFLVSGADIPQGDIIEHLSEALAKETKVTLKVDKNQYDLAENEFMRDAVEVLTTKGATVFTVLKNSENIKTRTKKRIKTKPQFHDKLMLIEYKDGTKKVIIGSAGFTTNVQANLNFENMISIDNLTVYNYFLAHFNSIEDSRSTLQVKKLQ